MRPRWPRPTGAIRSTIRRDSVAGSVRAELDAGSRMFADQIAVVAPGRQRVDRVPVDLENRVEFRARRPAAPAAPSRRAVEAEDHVPLAELVAIDQTERNPNVRSPR